MRDGHSYRLSSCELGGDNHVAELPQSVDNKQNAVAKGWQQKQGDRVQDQVSGETTKHHRGRSKPLSPLTGFLLHRSNLCNRAHAQAP